MAGDWIIFEHATLGKPEIAAIADRLEISKGDALLGLLRLWVWADQQSRNGHVPGVTEKHLNDEARVTGLAEAMIDVGWLVVSDDGVTFPAFGDLNGQTAKTRALARNRQRKHRAEASRDSHAGGVTKPSLQNRTEQNKEVEEEDSGTACPGDGEPSPISPKAANESSAAVPYKMIAEAWNAQTAGKGPPQVGDPAHLSAGRKKHLRARWREEAFRLHWSEVFASLTKSTFLCGQNDRGWRASFDWIIANDENWRKVLEGVFVRDQAAGGNGHGRTPVHTDGEMTLADRLKLGGDRSGKPDRKDGAA